MKPAVPQQESGLSTKMDRRPEQARQTDANSSGEFERVIKRLGSDGAGTGLRKGAVTVCAYPTKADGSEWWPGGPESPPPAWSRVASSRPAGWPRRASMNTLGRAWFVISAKPDVR